MTFWQNAVVFLVLGCVVYFPVLLVECLRQYREIQRLRKMLDDALALRGTTAVRKGRIDDARAVPTKTWVAREPEGGR